MEHIVSRGHTRPVTEINFFEDGPQRTLLISSAHDKLPQLRNGDNGDWIGSFKGHKGAVWSAKLDSFSRTLAVTASGDFTAKLWCASTGRELCEFKHKHVVKSVDFSMNTESIATGCQDGLMRVYNTCMPEKPPTEYKVSKTGADDSITKVSWIVGQPDLVMVGKKCGKVEIWDTRISSENNAPVASQSIGNNNSIIMDLEISPIHNTVLIAHDNMVTFLSVNDLSVIKSFNMPKPMQFKAEGGASLSPDGTRFLAGASDLWLREFDSTSGEVLQTMKGHHGPIRCVRYHPSGQIGASGSEDGTIRLWNLECNVI